MTLYNGINLFFIKLFTIVVPRRLHAPFAVVWGGLFYLLLTDKRRSVKNNLRVITGKTAVGGLAFCTFYKFARNWCDVMLMVGVTDSRLQALIGRRSSAKPLDDALSAGNGALLVSPHLGNWELGGLGLGDLDYKINVLTFREPDEKINAMREKVRGERGIGFIYVDRDDTSPLAAIAAVNTLRRNEVLCLLGDRDGSSNTVMVNFFGCPTPLPVGPAYLALATGAPMIPVFVVLDDDGRYATLMEEPIYVQGKHGANKDAIRTGMQQLADVFERYIRQYPDQWYNFFDFWGDRKE